MRQDSGAHDDHDQQTAWSSQDHQHQHDQQRGHHDQDSTSSDGGATFGGAACGQGSSSLDAHASPSDITSMPAHEEDQSMGHEEDQSMGHDTSSTHQDRTGHGRPAHKARHLIIDQPRRLTRDTLQEQEEQEEQDEEYASEGEEDGSESNSRSSSDHVGSEPESVTERKSAPEQLSKSRKRMLKTKTQQANRQLQLVVFPAL